MKNKEIIEPVKKLVTFDKKLIEQVNDFRFAYRCNSEAQAIRELVRRGLESFNPNAETIAAMREPLSSCNSASTVEEFWRKLNDEEDTVD